MTSLNLERNLTIFQRFVFVCCLVYMQMPHQKPMKILVNVLLDEKSMSCRMKNCGEKGFGISLVYIEL